MSLTACDTDQLGAAAVIGDERITVSELQDEVRTFHELAGSEATGDQTQLQLQFLNVEITHLIVEQVGADVGVDVSEAEIDQFIADQFFALNPEGGLTELALSNGLTEDGFRTVIHDNLMFEKVVQDLGSEQAAGEMYQAAAESMEIDVNPRYGTWDEVSFNPVSGSISVPEVSEPASQ